MADRAQNRMNLPVPGLVLVGLGQGCVDGNASHEGCEDDEGREMHPLVFQEV